MTTQPTAEKRKPGGQLGNTNAVKDGYYAARLHTRAQEIARQHAHHPLYNQKSPLPAPGRGRGLGPNTPIRLDKTNFQNHHI